MPRKQVTTKPDTGVMAFESEVPSYLDPESTRGQENVTVDDITIPRIGVLQDLSPQIKPSKPEYIEGAAAGQLFNNVTEELYGEDITIIPVYFRKEYIIWKDRDAGGGFKGAFNTIGEAQKAIADMEDANICEIVDTAQHFVLVVKPGPTIEEAVISMSKGTMGSSRQLNSLVKLSTGDRFARAYKMSAVEVSGQKGDYYSYKFHPLGYVPEEMYRAGEAMYEAVKAGERDINREYEGGETIESAEL